MVSHYDGSQWKPILMPVDRYPNKALKAIWCDADEPVAAGQGMMVTRNPSGWAQSWLGTETILGLWGPAGSDELWAVGTGGLVLKRSQGVWAPQVSGTTKKLNGISGRSANDIWVVGEQGTLLHFNGTWVTTQSPTTANLNAVWESPNGAITVLAGDGSILQRDSSTWSTAVPGSGKDYLFAWIWGDAPNDIWAVNGGLLHWDGQSWSSPSMPTNGGGPVTGTSGSDVYVLAYEQNTNAREVEHWNGSTWSVAHIGAGIGIWGICAAPGRGVWVVGGDLEPLDYPVGMPASVLHHDPMQ